MKRPTVKPSEKFKGGSRALRRRGNSSKRTSQVKSTKVKRETGTATNKTRKKFLYVKADAQSRSIKRASQTIVTDHGKVAGCAGVKVANIITEKRKE